MAAVVRSQRQTAVRRSTRTIPPEVRPLPLQGIRITTSDAKHAEHFRAERQSGGGQSIQEQRNTPFEVEGIRKHHIEAQRFQECNRERIKARGNEIKK